MLAILKKWVNRHDLKVNIRADSILMEMRSDTRIIYFIIFHNFVRNNSSNLTFKNCLEFSKD